MSFLVAIPSNPNKSRQFTLPWRYKYTREISIFDLCAPCNNFNSILFAFLPLNMFFYLSLCYLAHSNCMTIGHRVNSSFIRSIFWMVTKFNRKGFLVCVFSDNSMYKWYWASVVVIPTNEVIVLRMNTFDGWSWIGNSWDF